ncbi:MAG TPA: ribonuclease R [Syntrophaceae bacterium]|jgi:membrane protein|nr:ribonuclease R [Syntrophaceae bacterium]
MLVSRLQNIIWEAGRIISFLIEVLRGFKRNQGLLLSGAVAYYTLLSFIPLSILILIVLSHFVGEEQLFTTISTYMEMVLPGSAAILTEHARAFIQHRNVIGIIGLLVMLFFSSIAFTTLENAMSVIFFHRVRIQRRHFLTSAVIPYVYIFLMALGILLVSFIAGVLETLEEMKLVIFGWGLSLKGAPGIALYIIGMIGEVLMLTSLYLVMPVGRIMFHHALLGGITATVLWEIIRRVLVWYYSALSLVNLIYGSFATAVVFLLSIEAAALILLLGAQVIAELERKNEDLTGGKLSGFET